MTPKLEYGYTISAVNKILQQKKNKFQIVLKLCNTTESQLKILSQMGFECLTWINLKNSKIEGDKFCELISKWKCFSLSILSLSNKNITDEGVRALAWINSKYEDLLMMNQII